MKIKTWHDIKYILAWNFPKVYKLLYAQGSLEYICKRVHYYGWDFINIPYLSKLYNKNKSIIDKKAEDIRNMNYLKTYIKWHDIHLYKILVTANVLEDYINNFLQEQKNNGIDRFSVILRYKEYLFSPCIAFNWYKTKEGYDFWQNIQNIQNAVNSEYTRLKRKYVYEQKYY